MSESIHGHEVMRLLEQAGTPLTRAALAQRVIARWGAQARFHTCAAEDLDLDGLLDFLAARGKFAPVDGGWALRDDAVCEHED